jgi:DNA-binding CsgD family transcriptional regulator
MTASWLPPRGVLPDEPEPSRRAVASGETLDLLGATERLVGRRPELKRIDRLLAEARRGRAGSLLIVGDAGLGKTTLLKASVARADGFLAVEVRGLESETPLAHACLLELLTPLRRYLDGIPPGQARALAAALGWGPVSGGDDRFLIAAGTLSLLAAAAESAPLLVLVDDLQWVDAESAAALLFAARRMHRDRVAFLLAQRPGALTGVEGLDVLTLTDLPLTDVQDLLGPEVAGTAATALAARMGGNPLALLEVAANLSSGQRRGAVPLPDVLPVGGTLEGLFRPRLDALSADARRALVLLAATRDGRTSHVAAALELSGAKTEGALDEVEQHRLVRHDGETLAFQHPLIRSQVWQLTSPQQRRAAHRALADTARAGDAVAWTWHRAQAASGPDDELAEALVELADRARMHSGFAASSATLERAASLTTDAARSATRLAAAVTDAFVSGDVDHARELAARVLREESPASARGEALHVLGLLEQHAGSVHAARDLLREAIDLASGSTRMWSCGELALAQHRLGDVPGITETAERMAALHDGGPLRDALTAWVTGASQMHAGRPEHGRPTLRRALTVMESESSLRDDPRLLVYVMLGVSWLGALEEIPRIERRMRVARARGALGVLVTALSMSAYGRAEFLGDHAGAFADAGEAVELADQLGYVADAAPATELLAWEHSARGLHDDARRLLERARTLVTRSGTAEVAAHLAITTAFCALCRGDLHETVRVLEARIASDGGVGAVGEPLGVAPLLVEAYAGLGQRADAAALAERYAEESRLPLPTTVALVARCRALGSPDDDAAAAAFEESLAFHAESPDRFEAAHTRLLYGARLRRAGRRTRAREHLGAAAGQFAEMDLVHWARWAETELRATGQTARPRRHLTEEPLTSQETRVAMSAAQGLSNREIAAALFLSPKTVEHHLSSVYRKRGLRSRVELARAFRADSDGEPGA